MAEKRIRLEGETTTILDLPPDVLQLILTQFDHGEILPLSLVCKSFQSFTNGFVRKLTFKKPIPSDSAFSKVFARFSSVTRIAIRFTRIVRALTAIANSGLKIEGLEIYGKPSFPKLEQLIGLSGMLGQVKCLKFEWFSKVGELEVAEFVGLFQSLEELDLSWCGHLTWTDAGIEKLAFKCRNLRKVNLTHSNKLTNRSLVAFGANCVNLEHISFLGCFKLSFQGIWALVQKSKNLKSLELPGHVFSYSHEVDYLTLAKTKPICENMSHLSIDGSCITDAILNVIAGLHAPLTSLELKMSLFEQRTTSAYSITGLSVTLRAFQGLTKLNLYLPWAGTSTQDAEMSQLVKSLPHLKDVYLVAWSVFYATLFSLIHSCPLLESVGIKSTKVGNTCCDVPQGIRQNYSIQRININPCPDTYLKMVLKSLCPSSIILM